MVALLGTTGAGKSTIINLIPRFYDVTGGAVLVDGARRARGDAVEPARRRSASCCRRRCSSPARVRDNIAYGRPDATLRGRCARRRDAAQAHEFIDGLPQRLRHRHRRARRRPVGRTAPAHRHRARAARPQPRLLILDDSTSAVDAETEMAIQDALDRLMRDSRCTAFVIAQRISTVRDADLILVLDDGKIVASGKHEDARARRAASTTRSSARSSSPTKRRRRQQRRRGMRWPGTHRGDGVAGARSAPPTAAPSRAGSSASCARTAPSLVAAFGFILVNAVGAGGGAVAGEPRHRPRHRRPRRRRPRCASIAILLGVYVVTRAVRSARRRAASARTGQHLLADAARAAVRAAAGAAARRTSTSGPSATS